MNRQSTRFVRANRDLLIVSVLSVLVLVIYFQTTGFGFINLDDNLYVYDNPALKNGLNGDSIKWAFTAFWSANWHPLTWLSHGLDIQLFGMNSGLHHAVNLLFHLLNSILGFVVFRKMTGRTWESAMLAALFAVHPAHVESVAWVSERKDVLSSLFWLLTMWAYTKYAESEKVRRGESEQIISPSHLLTFSPPNLFVVVLFALGLMAKPMLVTLPFVLLLCDYWPLNRLRGTGDIFPRIAEKVPLFALSAASSVITYFAQRGSGAIETLDYLPLGTRVANATISYAKYILMFFHPADLAVWYPYEKVIQAWQVVAAAVILASISALCIWQLRRRPFLMVGWLWFIGTLVPVIGIVQVGSQALADRYTYVPYFGLFIMLIWGISSVVPDVSFSRRSLPFASVAGILILTALAMRQTSHWHDNEALYRHTLTVTSNNYLIDHNLCQHYVLNDRLDEAEPLCRKAIELDPNYYEPYNTLGILQFKRGQFAEAEAAFKQSLELAPGYVFAYLNLAQAQSRQGKPEEAEESLRLAVQYSGGVASSVFVPAFREVASAYAVEQKYDKSAENLRQALYLDPNNPQALAQMALTLYFLKQYTDAQADAEQALTLKGDLPEAWNTLGLTMLKQKQTDEAAKAFEKVVELDPDFPQAKDNLAKAQKPEHK